MAVLLLFLLSVSVTLASPWNAQNNPANFGQYRYTFSSLPTSGVTTTLPWSDTYWPSYQSGIAHRWYSANPQDFQYSFNTLAQLKAMSSKQLSQLSPAEKLDIMAGRYDYPTVQSEWQRTSPQDPTWEGLCHGWAPGSYFYQQPNPVTLKNPDGIQVPFGSSDVKALLIYFVAVYDDAIATQSFIGQRCQYDLQKNPSAASTPACADLNAGAFYTVLANQIGSLNAPFVVDRDRSAPVWNQPVYMFNTSIVSQSGSTVQLSTTMTYGKETAPQWTAHPTYPISETYSISLDLDANGRITGGNYSSGQWDRSDFAWYVNITSFAGYYKLVGTIYLASTGDSRALPEGELSAPRLSVSERPGFLHTEFAEPEGSVVVPAYDAPTRQSWALEFPGATTYELHFDAVDLDRPFDLIRVYEGANGTGALVAVLTGAHAEQRVTVKAAGVFVSFVARFDTHGGAGFTMSYKASNTHDSS